MGMSNLVPASWHGQVEEVRDRVSRAFDRMMPHPFERALAKAREQWPKEMMAEMAMPKVDIEETDDEINVTAEMPGRADKDFKVELEGRRLILRGEKKASREQKKRNFYLAENHYGSFYRAVQLPCEVDAGKVTASYKRGLLKVRMPKTEQAKARTIRVKVD
jgi:HSP20 family protein